MRKIELSLASALAAVLVLGGQSPAQPPDQNKDPLQRLDQRPPITVDDIVDWIMSFDKDKKGKVTKEDLPERMQYLIEKGDTNKDGALDKAEIRALALKLQKDGFARGGGFRVSGGGGPEGVRIGTGGPVGGPGPRVEQIGGILDDLKLDGKKKELAEAAGKAHQESLRKLMDQARTDLLQKMKDILSEEEFENFKAALDRPRSETFFRDVGPTDGPRPGELERKVDQLQKEVEDLRRRLQDDKKTSPRP
jgi:hypothetical protein